MTARITDRIAVLMKVPLKTSSTGLMRPAFLVDSQKLPTYLILYSIPRPDHAGSRTAICRISQAGSFRLYPCRTRGYEVRGWKAGWPASTVVLGAGYTLPHSAFLPKSGLIS